MHNHVIAGDFGYLPVYSDETGYKFSSEALNSLTEYVCHIVDSVEVGLETDYIQGESIETFWLRTGVVTDIGTNGLKETIQVVFDRNLASIDYAEISTCYEDCMVESFYS